MNSTIALLTDFGTKDNYVGVLKAVIRTINPKVCVIDLCHYIAPQDTLAAALTLKTSYCYFPKKTIFLVVVDPGVGSNRKAIILKTPNYTFVAPDNGILSLVANETKQHHVYQITNQRYFLQPVSHTFHGRDIFAPVAAYLSKNVLPQRLGRPQKTIQKINFPQPFLNKLKNQMDGKIIYVDRFGNLVTNIEGKFWESEKNNVSVLIKRKMIRGLSCSYCQVSGKRLLAIINSMGYLEISLNRGSASQYLHAKEGEKVTLLFPKA